MLPTISNSYGTSPSASSKRGKAYIDEQTSEQIAAQKGTPTQPGVESPYRNRPIEETLDLFQKMNTGEIEEGAMVLRAKIDMASPNMHFRDPIIYRVVKHPHHRTGTTWKAYPMYDFAHGQKRLLRRCNPLLVYTGIRSPPSVVRPLCRLGKRRQGPERPPSSPVRIQQAQPELYTHEQAQPADFGERRPCQRLGRPPYADYLRFPPSRLFTESIHKFIDKIGYTTYDALNEFAFAGECRTRRLERTPPAYPQY